VKSNHDTMLIHQNAADDPEFMKAFQEAIQDPERREAIIAFLETIGLLPSDPQSHA
jgi:hypothetical protein